MDANLTQRTLPKPAVVVLAIAATALAVLVLVTSTSVAASETILLEWIFSSSLIGAFAFLASTRITSQGGLRILAGIGSAVMYLTVRVTLALLAFLP